MLMVNFDKNQVIKMIKNYYEKNYYGQAIKVRINTRKIVPLIKDDNNLENVLFTTYQLSIRNEFLVSGYLEKNGTLHKFEKNLNSDELKMIIADALNCENEEVKKIEMTNHIKFSFSEEDKIGASFEGISVKTYEKTKNVFVFKK